MHMNTPQLRSPIIPEPAPLIQPKRSGTQHPQQRREQIFLERLPEGAPGTCQSSLVNNSNSRARVATHPHDLVAAIAPARYATSTFARWATRIAATNLGFVVVAAPLNPHHFPLLFRSTRCCRSMVRVGRQLEARPRVALAAAAPPTRTQPPPPQKSEVAPGLHGCASKSPVLVAQWYTAIVTGGPQHLVLSRASTKRVHTSSIPAPEPRIQPRRTSTSWPAVSNVRHVVTQTQDVLSERPQHPTRSAM